ncbi:MAG: hypothetical protein ACKVPX_06020 [Myxococcaceae bacterium]
MGATLAIDPVGGALTGTLLRALPEGGVVRIIGNLSGAPATFDPNDVMFRRKRVEGFTMYEWVKRTSLLGQMVMINRVQGLLHGPLATEIRARVPLADYRLALDAYERSMSGGKILLVPSTMKAGRPTVRGGEAPCKALASAP